MSRTRRLTTCFVQLRITPAQFTHTRGTSTLQNYVAFEFHPRVLIIPLTLDNQQPLEYPTSSAESKSVASTLTLSARSDKNNDLQNGRNNQERSSMPATPGTARRCFSAMLYSGLPLIGDKAGRCIDQIVESGRFTARSAMSAENKPRELIADFCSRHVLLIYHLPIRCLSQCVFQHGQTTEMLGFMAVLWMQNSVKVQEQDGHADSPGMASKTVLGGLSPPSRSPSHIARSATRG